MNVSGVTTFGSAAIASPPANDGPNVKPDDNKPVPLQVEPSAKPSGMGQFVDKSV